MRRLLLCLLLPTFASAASSLENAQRAARLLGEETWSRVVRIENTARHGLYPAQVDGLVFEFGGLLWFYTDRNGTQSVSMYAGNLAAEKADFAPLLREVDPGFRACAVLPAEPAVRAKHFFGPLPNGCFIESVAALRERLARGDLIRRARLLSIYAGTAAGRIGHTVLTYETPAGAFVLDPQRSRSPWRIGRRLPDDARVVADAARPDVTVTEARWVPTTLPKGASLLAAAAAARGAGTEADRVGRVQ